MCNATGGGCEPAARAVTTNVTDDGSLYGSSEALALKPGSRYYSTVAATGCGGVTARSRSETGVVCDEHSPVARLADDTLGRRYGGAPAAGAARGREVGGRVLGRRERRPLVPGLRRARRR